MKTMFSILFALLLMASLGLLTAALGRTVGPAYAAEAQPMAFAGIASTLTPAGPVPAGTLVQAYVGTDLRAETTTEAEGRYRNLLVPGPGGTVTFRVADVLAQESTTWESGEIMDDFDLTIPALPSAGYSLTMAASPVTGGTATDISGASPYAAGAAVSVKAVPVAGYRFVNWTASAGSFGNANAAATTFTMAAQDVTVTANFAVGGPAVWYVAEGGAGVQDGTNWNNAFATIQEAIDVAASGDTIMVAAGDYDAFVVDGKSNISIISTEEATITAAEVFGIDVGPIEYAWVMAALKDSENINIEGIDFDGARASGKPVVVGIAYLDSTGRIADLTVENIIGTELGAGVAILGHADTSAVDLSGIIVGNSMGGVIVWDAEANLDGCTITEMNPDGGFGIMESGVGVVIGIPGEGWSGPSSVAMKGSNISNNDGIGIYICDGSILEAHFNTIMANSACGLSNDGGGTVNATYNWWGHISGPRHLTNPSGMGNAIIGDVDFKPWLGAETVTQKIIHSGTVNATQQADTTVLVTGTAIVTVSNLTINPGGAPPPDTTPLGRYIDVYVPDATELEEIEIRHYYSDEDVGNISKILQRYLRLRWWDGTDWRSYSDGGVNTDSTGDYPGYIWGKVRANTEPRLTDLTGIYNGDFFEGPKFPGICFIATAAYGTDTAKEIDILREFRDTVLLPNSLGAKFVSFYYGTSPPVADFISRHEVLRTAVRAGLVGPIVKILNWTHDSWSARGP
jgi:hypothetical protein